jgi:5,10-methylenetetrahydromethanopterin reductase
MKDDAVQSVSSGHAEPRRPKLGGLLLGDLSPAALTRFVLAGEQAGYQTFWFADERFFRDPWPSITHAAQVSSTMGFGVCVTDPFARHIALTAREFATVSELTQNRVTLGLGSGISGFTEMGITPKRPVQALKESVEVLRPLLRGERVTFEGEVVRLVDAQLSTQPVAHPRIYIATNGPRTMRLAADVADGLIVQGMAAPLMVSNVREVTMPAPGVAPIGLVSRLDVCIAQDGAAARRRMLPSAVRHLKTHSPHFHSQRLAGLAVDDELARAVAAIPYSHDDGASEAVERTLPDEFVTQMFAAGTREEVRAQLQAVIEAGVREVLVRPVMLAGDDPVDMLALIGEVFDEAVAGALSLQVAAP